MDASRTIAVDKLAEMNGGFSFRNKIIDGKFDFWYEGTSQTSNGYGSDTMWYNQSTGSTKVHSMQALVAGVDLPAIDVPTATQFSRTVVTSVAGANNFVVKIQRIEFVQTLAGKTVTLSFYAKTNSAKNIAIALEQNFGATGSSAIYSIGAQLVGLTTSWQRFTRTITIPSISGKTISGGGDYLSVQFAFDIGSGYSSLWAGLGQQSGTFDIACVQLEEGSVATPFEELPPEISENRLNRYYEEGTNALIGSAHAAGYFVGTRIPFRQKKRVIPIITYGTAYEYVNIGTFNQTVDIATIRQWVSVTNTGNAYISRNFVADARL